MPGAEVAGVVTSLGEGVDDVEVGTRGVRLRFGGRLRRASVAKASSVRRLPDGVSFAESPDCFTHMGRLTTGLKNGAI